MRAIVINSDKSLSIRDIDGLEQMQAIVEGLIEPVGLSDGSDMYVNEEGLLIFGPERVNWIAADVASLGGRPEFMFGQPPLLGNAFILGPVDDDGNATDYTEQAMRWVKRVAREAGGVWVDEPANA